MTSMAEYVFYFHLHNASRMARTFVAQAYKADRLTVGN